MTVPETGQARVQWAAPTDPGTSAVTSYTVTVEPAGQTRTVSDCEDTTCGLTWTGLDPAGSCRFTVTAGNADGTSLPSEATQPVTPTVTVTHEPKVLSAAAGVALTEFKADGTMVFTSAPPEVQELAEGDYFSLRPAGAVPRGYLGRVLSRSQNGDKVILRVEAADLKDVLGDGDFSGAATLGADDPLSSTPPTSGARLLTDTGTGVQARNAQGSRQIRPLVLRIDHDFGGGARASGTVAITPVVTWQFNMGPRPSAKVSAKAVISGSVQLTAARARGPKKRDIRLGHYVLFAQTVMIGKVPVVITVELDPTRHLSGRASGAFRGIRVSPEQATTVNRSVQFTDIPLNVADGPVQWSVVRGPGSIDQNGLYVSPSEGEAVVQARRTNTSGVDQPTAQGLVRIGAARPGAPIDVKVPAGPSSALVSWQPDPTTLAGATGYAVVTSPATTTVYTHASSRSVRLSGLPPGQTYSVQVYALSGAGMSDPSEAATAIPTRGIAVDGDAVDIAVDAAGNPDNTGYAGSLPPFIYGAVLGGGNTDDRNFITQFSWSNSVLQNGIEVTLRLTRPARGGEGGPEPVDLDAEAGRGPAAPSCPLPVTAHHQGPSPVPGVPRPTTAEQRAGNGEDFPMKIVIIGGTGLIGSKVVSRLREQGHEAVAASPATGVNALTGEGLDAALAGARVVVDVTNSPSFEEAAVLEFFTTSTRNLLAAEAAAGVAHHAALSIVGIDGLPENGYFRAKVAQENLIKEGPTPYSIVRATQFFEFVRAIADGATDGGAVRVAPVLFQPMAADDVAEAVSRVAVEAPLKGTVEVAGPERFRFDQFVARALRAWDDPRTVVADPHAPYFGSEVAEHSLVPDEGGARLAETRFEDWLRRSA